MNISISFNRNNVIFLILFIFCSFSKNVVAQDLKKIEIHNNDILYVSTEDRIYVTTLDDGEINGNSLCVINPYFATIEECYYIGYSPNDLAISDDGSYMYIGLEDSTAIARFNMSTKEVDMIFSVDDSVSIPGIFADDILVLPDEPNSVVVARKDGWDNIKEIAIYDSGVQRPELSSSARANYLTFVESNGKLFGTKNSISPFKLFEFFINTNGVTGDDGIVDLAPGIGNKIESKDNYIYDETGNVIDASGVIPVLAGSFEFTIPALSYYAIVEPAPDTNLVYYIYTTTAGYVYFETFNLANFESVDYQQLPSGSGGNNLINWGTDRKLAFNSNNYVHILRDCSPLITDTLAIAEKAGGCIGDTVVLTAPPGYDNYYWSGGNVTSAGVGTQFIPIYEGFYTVSIMDSLGCVGPPSNTIEIGFDGSPSTPFINGELEICLGDHTNLLTPTGSSIEEVVWSTGATTNSIQVDTTSQVYVIHYSEFGCPSDTSEIVNTILLPDTIPNAPEINIFGNNYLCVGDTTILEAPSGYDLYSWYSGDTTQTIIVTSEGNYLVQVGNHEKCMSNYSIGGFIDMYFLSTPVITLNGQVLTSNLSNGHQWYLNGSPIPGAVNSTFTPTVEGIYTVNTSFETCVSEFSNEIEYIINDIKNLTLDDQFIIYPNPSTDELNITSQEKNKKVANIILVDLHGKIVATFQHNTVDTQVNIEKIPSGTYFIKFLDENDNLLIIKKWVKF